MLSVSLSTLFGTPDLDSAREEGARLHRQRAGRRAPRRLRAEPLAQPHAALGAAPGARRRRDRPRLAGRPGHRARRRRPRRRATGCCRPNCADRDEFAPFWQRAATPSRSRKRRERRATRLLLDIDARVRAAVRRRPHAGDAPAASPPRSTCAGTLLRACAARGRSTAADGAADRRRASTDARPAWPWVRGVLERMRTRGAIEHEWFAKFRQRGRQPVLVTGGRPRGEGMPAFPHGPLRPGVPARSAAPAARQRPRPGHLGAELVRRCGPRRCSGSAPPRAPCWPGCCFTRLRRRDVLGDDHLDQRRADLPPPGRAPSSRTLVDDADGSVRSRWSATSAATPSTATRTSVDAARRRALPGRPLRRDACGRTAVDPDNFYRRLYASTDIRRVVAREHTSLLDDEIRLRYENEFKGRAADPKAPNVLVATPTLEMGIDIGDLSTVMLASLPRSVASYLQRVGRAGRLTGNALDLAFVTGRGEQLPRLSRPAVDDQRRGPPARDLPRRRGDPAPPVRRLGRRRARPTTRTRRTPVNTRRHCGPPRRERILGELISRGRDPRRRAGRHLPRRIPTALTTTSSPGCGTSLTRRRHQRHQRTRGALSPASAGLEPAHRNTQAPPSRRREAPAGTEGARDLAGRHRRRQTRVAHRGGDSCG